jgi:biotin carboxylase
MKQVLRAAGVPCARHFLASDAASALAFAAEVGYPVVAKPPAGAGARNTMRVDDPAALGELLARLGPSATQPLLIEEYVVGDEHSFDAVSVHGRVVWHSLTHYTPGPLEVLRNPWIQWTVLLPREVDHPRYDDIRGVAVRALAALGQGTGLSHMEWFRRADGQVAISEVAARPPGAQFTTVISYAHDFDFYRAWARLVMFDAFEPPERRFAAGIAYLRGQGAGSVRAIHGLDLAQRELGPLVVETRLPRPGTPAADGYEGEGYVVLRHPRTEVVADGLARLVRLLRVELA